MAEYIEKYDFNTPPKEIEYIEGDQFQLNQDLIFYHNKNIFRKEITKLQNVFKSYTKNPLIASGIRDSYLSEEFFENYLLVLIMIGENVKKTNDIIKQNVGKTIDSGCYYLVCSSDYMLLLSKDMEGLTSGINVMEEIFTQTFEDYFKRKQFENFIKIRQFKIYSC